MSPHASKHAIWIEYHRRPPNLYDNPIGTEIGNMLTKFHLACIPQPNIQSKYIVTKRKLLYLEATNRVYIQS